MSKRSLAGVLLAGGTSKRMGQDKASYIYRGKPLMDYSLDVLKAVSKTQIIVSKDKRHTRQNTTMIPDVIENAGPLCGIYSALDFIDEDYAIVLACDTPYVGTDVINTMISSIDSYSIVIAKHNGRVHPTIGIYKQSIHKQLGDFLNNGNRKMMDFIESQDYTTVDFSYMDEKIFRNINSARDVI
jgi:molybdopterin-guanine dinucleotide biosynthesis protein A